MRYTLLSLILGSLLVVGGCSDSSSSLDPLFAPDSAAELDIVISVSVVDQGDDVIKDVEIEFFEDGVASTNILSVDGRVLSSLPVANGSFQITTKNDITSFTMVVSADGYLTKDVDVSFDANAETYTTQIELIAEDAKGVAKKIEKKSFANPISTINASITVTTDKPVSDGDTSMGSAGISIPPAIELQDAEGNPILVLELNVEVTYVESQEADDAAPEEGVVSVASIIPEGLNDVASDDAVTETEVLVPLSVAQVNMSNEDDKEIKKFSQPITITFNLPANTFIPSIGRTVQEGDQFTVRSYDEETQKWSTEPNKAIVGEANDDGTFPATLLVDHLTLFALTDPVAVCESPISFDFSGDDIPATGLQLSVKSNDINIVETIAQGSSSFAISADKAKSMGIAANAEASIAVKDFGGQPWYSSAGEIELCGQSVSVALDNLVVTVDQNLIIKEQCPGDPTTLRNLVNAIVTYQIDSNAVDFLANETAPGTYTLANLDTDQASYLVAVDTRTDAPNQSLTVSPNGDDQELLILLDCLPLTGTGAN